jgi:hypothetical protein
LPLARYRAVNSTKAPIARWDQKHRVTLKKEGNATQSFSYFFDDQLKTAPNQTLDYDANFNRTSSSSLPGGSNASLWHPPR